MSMVIPVLVMGLVDPCAAWGFVFLLAWSNINKTLSFPPSGIQDGYEPSQHCDELYLACDQEIL
jgi:hypothetical protein